MNKFSIAFFSLLLISTLVLSQEKKYVCPPCGCASDAKEFHSPGNCPSCNMQLLNKDNKSEGLDYTNLDPQEVCNLVEENTEVLLLDVRTEREFTTSPLGKLKNAKHIHVNELEDRVRELESFKEKEIIVYCLVGIRSARASQYLAENGFSKINNMLGGMELWNNQDADSLTCKTSLLEKTR